MTDHPKNRQERLALLSLADGEPTLLPKGVGHPTMYALREARLVRQAGYDPATGKTVWQLTSEGLRAVAGLSSQ